MDPFAGFVVGYLAVALLGAIAVILFGVTRMLTEVQAVSDAITNDLLPAVAAANAKLDQLAGERVEQADRDALTTAAGAITAAGQSLLAKVNSIPAVLLAVCLFAFAGAGQARAQGCRGYSGGAGCQGYTVTYAAPASYGCQGYTAGYSFRPVVGAGRLIGRTVLRPFAGFRYRAETRALARANSHACAVALPQAQAYAAASAWPSAAPACGNPTCPCADCACYPQCDCGPDTVRRLALPAAMPGKVARTVCDAFGCRVIWE